MYFLYICIKLFKNFIPSKKVRHELKHKQEQYLEKSKRATLNFIDIKDYLNRYHLNNKSYTIDNINVYELEDFYISMYEKDSRVFSYIHDKNKNVLYQSNAWAWSQYFLIEPINFDKPIMHIDKAVNFALQWNDNYWHFTITVLGKIFTLEKNGFDGKYIIPNVSYIIELLELAGINKDKLIFSDKDTIYRVEKLYVFEYMRNFEDAYVNGDFISDDAIKTIRESILNHIDIKHISIKYPKRIFVSRIGTRKLIMSDKIKDILKKYNFEVIIPEKLSVKEQIKYFYAADIVITPHGANSTNVLFMRPNTHFIELFGYNYITPYMLDVIRCNNLYYNMLVERGYLGDNSEKRGVFADFYIAPILLEDTLYKIC